jgi:hypothetical protein
MRAADAVPRAHFGFTGRPPTAPLGAPPTNKWSQLKLKFKPAARN